MKSFRKMAYTIDPASASATRDLLDEYPNDPIKAIWAALRDTQLPKWKSLGIAMFIVRDTSCGLERRRNGRDPSDDPTLHSIGMATPLHIAAAADRVDFMEMLLADGADIDATENENGRTALHLVGSVAAIKVLVANRANLEAADREGFTPLMTCVRNKQSAGNQVELITALVAAGCDLTARRKKTGYPGLQYTALHIAAHFDCHVALRALLSAGANSKNIDNFYRILEVAIEQRQLNAVKVLVEVTDDINALDDGFAPLHYVRDIAIADVLISKGASVSVRSCNGETPLHSATGSESSEISLYLLSHGADVGAQSHCVYEGATPLHEAAFASKNFLIDELLDAGSDLEAQSTVGTPLHRAVAARRVNSVRILLDAGANVNSRNRVGNAPLHLAADKDCDPSLVPLLIQGGALVNITNSYGQTPLHLAALVGDYACISALVDAGGDVNVIDSRGNTAYALFAHNARETSWKTMLSPPPLANLPLADKESIKHKLAPNTVATASARYSCAIS